jgi:hypothetical protein
MINLTHTYEPYRILFLLIILHLPAFTKCEEISVINGHTITKKKESLLEILKRLKVGKTQVNSLVYINEMKKKNPHIRNFKSIPAGTKVFLTLSRRLNIKRQQENKLSISYGMSLNFARYKTLNGENSISYQQTTPLDLTLSHASKQNGRFKFLTNVIISKQNRVLSVTEAPSQTPPLTHQFGSTVRVTTNYKPLQVITGVSLLNFLTIPPENAIQGNEITFEKNNIVFFTLGPLTTFNFFEKKANISILYGKSIISKSNSTRPYSGHSISATAFTSLFKSYSLNMSFSNLFLSGPAQLRIARVHASFGIGF